MDFTRDDMFRHSFVMVKDDKEYKRFCGRFVAQGFDVMPKVFYGNFPKCLVGDKGDRSKFVLCSLAHFSLVRMAKTLDLPHITIFESDAYPMKGCREELGRLLENGVPDDSDELVFGNIQFIRKFDGFLKDVGCGFGRIKENLWGAHSVVIFSRAYDQWLRSYLECNWEIHADFFNNIVRNCYAATRSFFIQAKDSLEYPDYMVDKEYLCDFPEI